MSKQHPHQDYYKIGGRAQSDGADRAEDLQREKQEFARIDKSAHPAVKRSAKKK
jgi:hypothetical protein